MAETRTIAASKARDEMGDLLNRVAYSRERVVIERSRKPVAALIPLEDLRLLEALLEERQERLDAEAATSALRDAHDEVLPFERKQ